MHVQKLLLATRIHFDTYSCYVCRRTTKWCQCHTYIHEKISTKQHVLSTVKEAVSGAEHCPRVQ